MQLTSPTGTRTLTLGPDESLDITLRDDQPGSRQFTLEVIHQSPRSRCTVRGVAQAFGRDQKVWQITQRLCGPHQSADITLHGTAEDHATLQFDGVGELARSSTQGTVNIEERIMLFDSARGRSLPVLTVMTDDVAAASHAASIAPVSPDILLYCASRGLSPTTAKHMVKAGFLR